MFVFAMDMVSPPLSAEECQEKRSAGDLSDDSREKRAADQSGKDRDSCSDQRRANVAPGIFPMKNPPESRITQDALNNIWQKNTVRRAQCAKSWNEPEKPGCRDRAGDQRVQKIQMWPLHHNHCFAQRDKCIDSTGKGDDADPNATLPKCWTVDE